VLLRVDTIADYEKLPDELKQWIANLVDVLNTNFQTIESEL
jgi:hypothetical protein